jgi:hypothetical protein
MNSLHALVLSLPTRNSTVRMRVWRALKDSGAGVLRDGVYVLPADAPGASVLEATGTEIRASGGFAMTLEVKPRTGAEAAQVRKLFDRSAHYGALVRNVTAVQGTLARLGARKARTALHRVQRAFDRLSEIDFYPGPAREQAGAALGEALRRFDALYSGGEPRPTGKRPRALDVKRYRKRVWTTRKDLWVDRIASAWLIKRFIDREARFAWADRPRDRPKGAVGFDFDGAEFTHVGNRVTFEVLRASFGLDGDPSLAAIGDAVRFLDIGGIPVADAKGLETVLKGIKEKARDDDALLAEASRVLDAFYAAYAQGGN